ncbi:MULTISPECIES: hypothetical protein [Streptomyces]|uniref:Uncharacterized protein n=1 Tax=Streptomyces morookaense TaxID=1970 RepID=A0A7Y7E941_STRMO|nr:MULTISPECIES: hypothetical protein [Streptomyces]MCC2276466.1 hypothetical protein [Streptomyces sp. ET3-23]NVK80685.1 hypothetical protein [Streptomyces morookaense]GHF52037.1 hypothetical protein GCM10010359_63060 [Streptomyces morookaense]
MSDTARRSTAARAQSPGAADVFGERPSPTRHPLVATVMVLPLAAFLAVAFGGWHAVVTQASSVAGMLGR